MYVSPDKGATWQARALPPGKLLRAVAFLDARRGFVVGYDGLLLGTSDGGKTWQQVPIPVQENLTNVQFLGDQGWVTGWSGVILHSEDAGRTWVRQPTGVNQALDDVFFIDKDCGWAVGWVGTILRTSNGGRTWQAVATPEMLWSLSSVRFRDRQNGWATGFGGEILRTRDGGATWKDLPKPNGKWLSSIFFDSSGRGWITADDVLLVSDGGGENWKPIEVENALFLRRLLQFDGSLWAIGQFGVLRQKGSKWERLDTFVRPKNEDEELSVPDVPEPASAQ